MKIKVRSFYALLLGVAVVIPVVGHTVTLPTASRTPCFFGALGSSTACAEVRQASDDAPMARGMIKPLTPQTTPGSVDTTVAVSSVVSPATPAQTAPDTTAVASVPLPLAGGLLLGSMGLMFAAVRKKAR